MIARSSILRSSSKYFAASTRPLRALPPSGATAEKLCEPYGEEIKGFHCGTVCASVPEPEEVWLAVLAAAVPFAKRMLVVAPPSLTYEDSRRLAKRASAAFTGILHAASDPPIVATCTTNNFMTFQMPNERARIGGDEEFLEVVSAARKARTTDTKRRSDALVANGGKAGALAVPHGSAQPANPHLSDVIVFAADAFSHSLPDAPAFITNAFQRLHRYGVLAIIGTQVRAQFAGPQGVSLNAAVDEIVDVVLSEMMTDTPQAELFRSARDSRRVLHEDIYLPFANVRRRTFTSEYVVRPEDIIAYMRSWPEYRYAMIEKDKRRVAAQTSAPPSSGVDPVSFRLPHFRGNAADPLQHFASCLEGEVSASNSMMMRMDVPYFVITCDNRVQGGGVTTSLPLR